MCSYLPLRTSRNEGSQEKKRDPLATVCIYLHIHTDKQTCIMQNYVVLNCICIYSQTLVTRRIYNKPIRYIYLLIPTLPHVPSPFLHLPTSFPSPPIPPLIPPATFPPPPHLLCNLLDDTDHVMGRLIKWEILTCLQSDPPTNISILLHSLLILSTLTDAAAVSMPVWYNESCNLALSSWSSSLKWRRYRRAYGDQLRTLRTPGSPLKICR